VYTQKPIENRLILFFLDSKGITEFFKSQ